MKQIRSLTIENKRDEFLLESEVDDPITELDVRQGATPSEDEDKGYMLIARPKTESSQAGITVSNLYYPADQKLSLPVDGSNFKVVILLMVCFNEI